MRSRQAQSGFTLLEAMVALVVLGLVLALAASAMGAFGTARARVNMAADRAGQLALVGDVLRRQVSRALPLTHANGNGDAYLLTASADRLTFPLVDTPLPGRGGLTMATLMVRDGQLIWRQERVDRPSYETILAEGDFQFRLSYRGDDPRQGWVEDWDQPRRWPRLVRLSIQAAGREMPAIIIPIRVDTDRGCALSLGEGFCHDHEG